MSKKVPDTHVTGRQGLLVLQNSLPKTWIWRPEDGDTDYGVDGTIEIVDDGAATANRVYAQVKGTTALKRRANSVSFSIEVDDLLYLDGHQLATVLVLVDVNSGELFWCDVQHYVSQVLNKEKPNWRDQETITISIPNVGFTADDIESKWPTMAAEGPTINSIAKAGVPNWDLVKRAKAISKDDVASALDAKAEVSALYGGAVLDEALALRNSGDMDGGDAKLQEAWKHAESSGDATLILQAARAIAILGNPTDYANNRNLFEIAQKGAQAAETLGRKADAMHLRGLSLITVGHYVLHRVSNAHMLAKMSDAAGDEGTGALYRLMNQEPATRLHGIRMDLEGLIDEALANGKYIVGAELLRETADLDLTIAQMSGVIDENADTSDLVSASIARYEAACSIASRLDIPRYEGEMLLAKAKAQARANELEAGKATLETARILIEKHDIAELVPWLQHAQEVLPSLVFTPKKGQYNDATEDEKKEFLEHVIREVGGVDLDDPEDEIAWILRVGLKDRNPERILRYCEHLEWAPVAWGMPATTFGLPTAGSKMLFCPVVDKSEWGYEMDTLRDRFADGHCVGCPERCPRPKEWAWTEEWQNQQQVSDALQKRIDAFRNM